MCHRRMAVMHLPTKFCANSSIHLGVIDIFRNPRFSSHVNLEHSVMLIVWCYIKFGSNICDSHSDQHTYAPDIHLMTSRELTSSFYFWSRGHLRVTMVHLQI